MLGSTTPELEGLKSAEDAQKKRPNTAGTGSQTFGQGESYPICLEELYERIEAISRKPKVRSTTVGCCYSNPHFPPLRTPNPIPALSLLKRLSSDPAIMHIMQQHRFSVGLLAELAPHEHYTLLGLNANAGEAIKIAGADKRP
jgi:hypothetical protein